MEPIKSRTLSNVGGPIKNSALLKVDESILRESMLDSHSVKQSALTPIKAEIDRLIVQKQKLEAQARQIDHECQLNEQFLIAQQRQLMSYEKQQEPLKRSLEELTKAVADSKEETRRLIEKHRRELGLYEKARSEVSDTQSQDQMSELLVSQLSLYDRELQQQEARINYLAKSGQEEIDMISEITQMLAGELAVAQKLRIADLQTLLRQERELAYLKQRLPDVVTTGKTAVRGKKCVIDLS